MNASTKLYSPIQKDMNASTKLYSPIQKDMNASTKLYSPIQKDMNALLKAVLTHCVGEKDMKPQQSCTHPYRKT